MIDAHCGFPVRMPPSFRPSKKAVQVYVPSDKNGVIKRLQGQDFERLSTYSQHVLMKNVGDKVKRARDLSSFAAHVWLIGEEEAVMHDAKRARDEFIVEVEEWEDEVQGKYKVFEDEE